MKMKDDTQKHSIWVLHSDAMNGGYLFYGNPNQNIPPYHLGGLDSILYGEKLVWANTRKVIENEAGVLWWNERFPKHRVKPKSVIVEIRPCYKRLKKESEAKEAETTSSTTTTSKGESK